MQNAHCIAQKQLVQLLLSNTNIDSAQFHFHHYLLSRQLLIIRQRINPISTLLLSDQSISQE